MTQDAAAEGDCRGAAGPAASGPVKAILGGRHGTPAGPRPVGGQHGRGGENRAGVSKATMLPLVTTKETLALDALYAVGPRARPQPATPARCAATCSRCCARGPAWRAAARTAG